MRNLAPFVHTASLSDLDDLCELESLFPGDRLSRRSFMHLLRQGHADILICEDNGAIAGNIVVLYRRGSRRGRIYSLVVHPESRRRGIARILIEEAEKAALIRGCRQVGLEVRVDNDAALRLYKNIGYKPVGRIEKYYEDNAAAIRLAKSLNS